jgi:hypothetical protein
MTALSKAVPCLLLGLSTMMVLQGCTAGPALNSEILQFSLDVCPASHNPSMCKILKDSGNWVDDPNCCAHRQKGSCGTEAAGVDGQEYVNFGYGAYHYDYGAHYYEKVCEQLEISEEDQAELRLGLKWKYSTCCIKWNEFATIFCKDSSGNILDAKMAKEAGSDETGASNGLDGRAGSSICLEVDEGGAEVANLDCRAPKDKGACKAGYTFTQGERVGEEADGYSTYLFATCCVPTGSNSTRLLAAADLFA